MKSIIIIILIVAFLPAQSEEEPFWEYIGGLNGGQCEALCFNKSNNILYLTTKNGIFKSTNNGKIWQKIYYYEKYSKCVVNKKGNILDVNNENEVFFYNISTKKRIKIEGLKLKNAFRQWLYMNIDSNDNCFIVDQQTQNDDTVKLYLYNARTFKLDSMKIIRSELDTTKRNKYFINQTKMQDGIISIIILVSGVNLKERYSIIMFLDYNLNIISKINTPRMWTIEFKNNKIVGTSIDEGKSYLSTNNGKSWEIIFNKTGTFKRTNNFLFFFSYISYINERAYDSIYVSNDFGKNWKTVGYSNQIFNRAYVFNDSNYWGCNNQTVYLYDKQYRNWKRKDKGVQAQKIRDMGYTRDGKTIYAVSYGVQKSTDNGKNWQYCGLDDQMLYHILVARNGYIYVSGGLGGILKGNIFRSTDGGKSWKWLKLSSNKSYMITSLYENRRGHIFAGRNGSYGYFYTTDSGESWELKSTPGGTNCFSENSEGHKFRGDYAAIVYRSTDDGDSWQQMTEHYSGDNCFWDIKRIPFDPHGTKGWALCMKTTDNGRTWEQFNYQDTEPFTPTNFDSLGNYLIPGWRSTDKGKNWEKITSRLNHKRYNILTVSPNGYYFLGAENGGLYRSRKNYVSVEPAPQRQAGTITPNPATNYIDIAVVGNRILKNAVRMYDVLGNTVLSSPACSAGTPSEGGHIRLDVSGLAAGVYFVRVGSKMYKFVKM